MRSSSRRALLLGAASGRAQSQSLRSLFRRLPARPQAAVRSSSTAAGQVAQAPKKKGGIGAGTVLLGGVAAAALVLDFMPEPVLQFAAKSAEKDTGMTVKWQKVSGALHGNLVFEGMSVVRPEAKCMNNDSAMDLKIAKVELSYSPFAAVGKHLSR